MINSLIIYIFNERSFDPLTLTKLSCQLEEMYKTIAKYSPLVDILGAGIGVDGVHASLAGFGFRVGPRMEIKTPIADVSCSIM